MSDQTEEQQAAAAKRQADEKTAAAAKTLAKVKVRVIVDQGDHSIDDVLSLSSHDAKAAVAAGWADDNPSAVKYAEGIKKAADANVAD
jgi:hypothetical protein